MRFIVANLYMLKCLDSFDPAMMADGQISRNLSFTFKHDNRTLQDIVVKFP